MAAASPVAQVSSADASRAKSLGVTIEASYSVGEYDILILSATESSGLETWLRSSGYRIPAGASEVLNSYIRQNMRFFVAKVNLAEQAKLGFSTLRPIQVAYESPKFMLPIRLGTVNADGTQEMYIYTLTRKGRVESTNYRTVKLRTDVEIPTFVKDPKEFARMYRAMFDQHVKREQMNAVFLDTPGTWAGAIRVRQIRCRPMSCGGSASIGWASRPPASGRRARRSPVHRTSS